MQRMQKMLTPMKVPLAHVLTDITGVRGQEIIQAMLGGERDPKQLAAFRDCRVRASEQEIAAHLQGNWQEDSLFVLQQEHDA